MWLWQGWWPDVGHDANDTNTTTGSGFIRWHSERRAAMQCIYEYRKIKGFRNRAMKLVWAGHEPEDFTNLFPRWILKDHIKTLNDQVIILNAGPFTDNSISNPISLFTIVYTSDIGITFLKFQYVGSSSLEIVLEQLSKTSYSWEDLQQRPLPDGVDPSRLERYLTDDDFEVSG